MFRRMRRFKQQISDEECRELLKSSKRGVLSLLGDDGYPYGVPVDHWYCEEDGKIYFHGAREGHKIDSIRRNAKASYCIMDNGYSNPGEWILHIKSVVVFGKMEFVTDDEKIVEICTHLVKKFTDDENYLRQELAKAINRVQCLALVPEHITGKLVEES
ncbi:MAG: pyridoxamine 5'-phosphate oxidase family protein [Anaerovibrio sp.]|nr:pyridoxamine 5'-phosphate oxidase family protein [Anaerovibrio sp.]